MWIIQNDALIRLPDDAPVPPNSRVVEVPENFLRQARHYRVRDGELVRVDFTPAASEDKLTRDDIRQIKTMLNARTPRKKEEK